MKKQLCSIALGSLLALGMSAAASAQDNSMQQQPPADAMQGHGMHHGGDMNPDEMLARMTKRYNLTTDQQSQLKPILADHQQQMMQLRSDNSMSREDKHAKMESLHQDHVAKVEALLTPDQKAKFEKDQARMQEHRGEHMHGGAMGGQDAGTPPQQ